METLSLISTDSFDRRGGDHARDRQTDVRGWLLSERQTYEHTRRWQTDEFDPSIISDNINKIFEILINGLKKKKFLVP